MAISLDSCVIIDLANGRSASLRERFLAARRQETVFVVSSLVYQEISFGAFVGRSFANQMASLNSIIDGFPIEPFTWLDAKEAARVRADLRHQGQAIDGLDALIAGQALARGWSVATSNLRHFQRVAGLTVADWTP